MQLLELVRCEDRSELLPRLLVDRFHLLSPDDRGDRGVVGQSGDLLVAIGEDGFELCGLVGRQVEFFGESCGLTLGIVGVLVPWGGSGRPCLLCKDKSAGEGQSQGGRE